MIVCDLSQQSAPSRLARSRATQVMVVAVNVIEANVIEFKVIKFKVIKVRAIKVRNLGSTTVTLNPRSPLPPLGCYGQNGKPQQLDLYLVP